ncbi:RIP metalloprotease RseP [Micrococcales bacterium KH10]|nr:RIP metalloprotease RseP [Micrococcales bacterium KH10]
MVLGIIVIVIGILVSIALHEVGHMVPAKKFGVRVSQYFVGFGPTVWSRQKGETEYGIKAIPLGGFVRLIGMYPPAPAGTKPRSGRMSDLVEDARQASAEEILPGQEPRAFYNLSAPKKLIVMLGGPVMNLLIAIVLIAIVQVGFGQQVVSTTIDSAVPCLGATVSTTREGEACGPDEIAAPAYAAGLRSGDKITAVDGRAVASWDEIPDALAAAGTAPVTVDFEREGQPQQVTLTPVTVTSVANDGTSTTRTQIGIAPAYEWQSEPLSTVPSSVWTQVTMTADVVLQLPVKVYDTARAVWGGQERGDDAVLSVVGVGRLAGEITATDIPGAPANTSWVILLQLLASLNIALFVFNLIPLVPLDGGHVAGAIYEGARRQIARWRRRPSPGPADTAKMVPVAYGMFAALIVMAAIMITADIVAPVSIF